MNFMPPQCRPDPVVIPPQSHIRHAGNFLRRKRPARQFHLPDRPLSPRRDSPLCFLLSRPHITRLSGAPLSDSPAFPGAFLPQCLILLSEIPRVCSSAYRPSPHRQSVCGSLNQARHGLKRIGSSHTLDGPELRSNEPLQPQRKDAHS